MCGSLKVPRQLFVAKAHLSTVPHRTFRCGCRSHQIRPKSLNKHVPCDVPRSKGLQGSFYAFVEARLTERKKSRGYGLSSVFGTIVTRISKMYDIMCAPFFALATRPIHSNLQSAV